MKITMETNKKIDGLNVHRNQVANALQNQQNKLKLLNSQEEMLKAKIAIYTAQIDEVKNGIVRVQTHINKLNTELTEITERIVNFK